MTVDNNTEKVLAQTAPVASPEGESLLDATNSVSINGVRELEISPAVNTLLFVDLSGLFDTNLSAPKFQMPSVLGSVEGFTTKLYLRPDTLEGMIEYGTAETAIFAANYLAGERTEIENNSSGLHLLDETLTIGTTPQAIVASAASTTTTEAATAVTSAEEVVASATAPVDVLPEAVLSTGGSSVSEVIRGTFKAAREPETVAIASSGASSEQYVHEQASEGAPTDVSEGDAPAVFVESRIATLDVEIEPSPVATSSNGSSAEIHPASIKVEIERTETPAEVAIFEGRKDAIDRSEQAFHQVNDVKKVSADQTDGKDEPVQVAHHSEKGEKVEPKAKAESVEKVGELDPLELAADISEKMVGFAGVVAAAHMKDNPIESARYTQELRDAERKIASAKMSSDTGDGQSHETSEEEMFETPEAVA